MPTCQACTCTNSTGITTKGKIFFEILNLKTQKNEKKRSNVYAISVWHRAKIVKGAEPTIFAHQRFDKINIDGTKIFLTKQISENKGK